MDKCCKLSLNVIKCNCTISTRNVKSQFLKPIVLTLRLLFVVYRSMGLILFFESREFLTEFRKLLSEMLLIFLL